MKENWLFQWSLKRKLRKIIDGGNPEYQQLFNLIVKIHREIYFEENIPTTRGEIEEMLHNAIDRSAMIENLQYEKSLHNIQANDLEKKISEIK